VLKTQTKKRAVLTSFVSQVDTVSVSAGNSWAFTKWLKHWVGQSP